MRQHLSGLSTIVDITWLILVFTKDQYSYAVFRVHPKQRGPTCHTRLAPVRACQLLGLVDKRLEHRESARNKVGSE
jgi:hypothetical protein